jgi:RHS repeat-associated protein
MFQGRPHFALDTAADAEHDEAQILLNDHRNRFNDPVIGRWLNRDPIGYRAGSVNLYECAGSNPTKHLDPTGTDIIDDAVETAKTSSGKACAVALEVALSVPLKVPGGYGPAFSHCLTHCLIARHCPNGEAASKWQGMLTEEVQEKLCLCYIYQGKVPPAGLCESAMQLSDFWDNELGRRLAKKPGSCYNNCKEAMGGTKHAEGPRTDRPFGPRHPIHPGESPWKPRTWRDPKTWWGPRETKPMPEGWPPKPRPSPTPSGSKHDEKPSVADGGMGPHPPPP